MKRYFLMGLMVMVTGVVTAAVKAPMSDVEVKVFANTAIVSIYDFNADNLLARQKSSAKRFTSSGWIAFSKALTSSHLLEMVKKHHYKVSAVAMRPPEITNHGLNEGVYQWMVTMPTMVVFKNPDYQQVQYLDVSLVIHYQKGKLLVSQITSVPGKALACEKTSENLTVKASSSKDDKSSDTKDEKADSNDKSSDKDKKADDEKHQEQSPQQKPADS